MSRADRVHGAQGDYPPRCRRLSLAGSVWNETEATLVGNLWSHLTSD